MSVLLLGNGINLKEKIAPKWNKLLEEIAKKFNFTPGSSLSMTLGYEMLENQILKSNPRLKEMEIHSEIAAQIETDKLKQKKDWSNTIHEKLTSLPVNAILTTNYDYALERCLDPFFQTVYNTRETIYSLHRYQEAGEKIIYHIHGECGYPRSICLGYEQYVGGLQRIREQIVQGTASNKEAKKQGYTYLLADIMRGLTDRPEHSWIYDFFLEDVYIFAITLDISELDLWWLLSYRSKLIARKTLPIKNRIYFLEINSNDPKEQEENNKRRDLLKAFDVECIQCVGKDFDEQYGFAYKWLKDNIS